jgi:hypothetical protein
MTPFTKFAIIALRRQSKARQAKMASMTKINCKWCRKEKDVRTADVKRGWGMFCNKTCKAAHQESKTGQYAKYKQRLAEHEDSNPYDGVYFSDHDSNIEIDNSECEFGQNEDFN